MTEKTAHFLKTIGLTTEEIDFIHKKASKSADLLPKIFMRQLERSSHARTPGVRSYRKMSPEDFAKLLETFKIKVLENPLKAAAEMAKGNILREK